MYWDPLKGLIRESVQPARKEHVCCEHGKIAVGEKYRRMDGIWLKKNDYLEPYRQTVKICLRCEEDWITVLKIFHENGEYGTWLIYGELKEVILDILECDYIGGTHPLVKKWYPERHRASLREAGVSEEEIAWKDAEEIAVRIGLQPALPGI